MLLGDDPQERLPYQRLLDALGPLPALERLGLVTEGQMDGVPRPGTCIGGGGHEAPQTWIVPRDLSRYCLPHLRELLRRVAWWPEPLPPL